jgi:hypothetical protein
VRVTHSGQETASGAITARIQHFGNNRILQQGYTVGVRGFGPVGDGRNSVTMRKRAQHRFFLLALHIDDICYIIF